MLGMAQCKESDAPSEVAVKESATESEKDKKTSKQPAKGSLQEMRFPDQRQPLHFTLPRPGNVWTGAGLGTALTGLAARVGTWTAVPWNGLRGAAAASRVLTNGS